MSFGWTWRKAESELAKNWRALEEAGGGWRAIKS